MLTWQIDSHLYFVHTDFKFLVKTLSQVVNEAPGCCFCLTDTQGVEGLKDFEWTPLFPHENPYAALEKVHLWNKDVYLPLCTNENLKTSCQQINESEPLTLMQCFALLPVSLSSSR